MTTKVLRTVHETARSFFESGIMDEATMREFDALCLPAARPRSAEDIRALRVANHANQAVFAAFLGVAKSTVQQWEQGHQRPSATALRLMEIVEREGLKALLGPMSAKAAA